jgi:hypothetical protein
VMVCIFFWRSIFWDIFNFLEYLTLIFFVLISENSG